MGILNPVTTTPINRGTSLGMTSDIKERILGNKEFNHWDHKLNMRSKKGALFKISETTDRENRVKVLNTMNNQSKIRALKIAPINGAWFSTSPLVWNGTILSKEEFRDTL